MPLMTGMVSYDTIPYHFYWYMVYGSTNHTPHTNDGGITYHHYFSYGDGKYGTIPHAIPYTII